MPGKQEIPYAGLLITATPNGARGLYFTDETIEVEFYLKNTTNKRLRGEFTAFYGFGPTGLEGKTIENIQFDITPQGTQEVFALKRLVGIQGNGVIGMSVPGSRREQDIIQSENEKEQVLKAFGITSSFRTLYTFTSMEREFYERFYERPEKLMEQTRKLSKWVVILTIAICVLTVALIAIGIIQITMGK